MEIAMAEPADQFAAAGLRRTAVLETDSPLCVVEATAIER